MNFLTNSEQQPRTSTFVIHLDICNACGACFDILEGLVGINDDGKPILNNNGIFGSDEMDRVFEAIKVCPVEAIEEVG